MHGFPILAIQLDRNCPSVPSVFHSLSSPCRLLDLPSS
jgi:hypothetical protein